MSYDPLETQILEKLTYLEEFGMLKTEVDAPEKILADVLKGLIQKRLVYPVEEGSAQKRGFIYDSDNLHAYRYIISGKGMGFLQSEKNKNRIN